MRCCQGFWCLNFIVIGGVLASYVGGVVYRDVSYGIYIDIGDVVGSTDNEEVELVVEDEVNFEVRRSVNRGIKDGVYVKIGGSVY